MCIVFASKYLIAHMYMVGHFCNGLKFLTYANSEDPDQRSSD